MLKFFPGILLVQGVTIALFFAVMQAGLDNTQLVLAIGLLEILFCVLASFWFSAMTRQQHRNELATIKEEHALEREKIKVSAERQKSKILNKSQQQILKETKRANAAANFKVGAAFAGALAFGGIMLYSQFVTVGLLILTTAGGGLAGYLVRGKQLARARKQVITARPQEKIPQKKEKKS
ncbi:MAG TPA: hypothetical protein ENK96_08895 [Desulfobulbaceae bacterium]|nr:hypothetical protein [Desulfobulbaceae bacterium]